MRQLSEITGQPISDLVATYFICATCGIVDRDWDRMKAGHPCSSCSTPSGAGRLAFPVNIHILADLVQQTFHSEAQIPRIAGPLAADVGAVLIFCTLREALLTNFLKGNLQARDVDAEIIDRLMEDNKLASQKFGQLFSSIVGAKWQVAVQALSDKAARNYLNISDLMKETSQVRNEFLHEGKGWGMNRDLSKRCVDSLADLFSLFAALHNEYTTPYVRRVA
jgi:hypothetical protein